MFVTKDLCKILFDYIDPWGDILSSVAWEMWASHHSTFNNTQAQLVFGRDMIFNLLKFLDWRKITMRKQAQVHQDNQQENAKWIKYDSDVGIQE